MHFFVKRPDAVYAAVSLNQPHRIPRQVVVDDVASLLQVDSLSQHICGDHDVVFVFVIASASCQRSEAQQHIRLVAHPVRTRDLGYSLPICGQRRGGLGGFVLKMLINPVDRVGIIGENQDFAPVASVLLVFPAAGGICKNLFQRLGQSFERRVVPAGDLPCFFCELPQKSRVVFYISQQPIRIVVRGIVLGFFNEFLG